ncbi:hypothetical protein LIER_25775 [Lithospermum erythrorhizon]|uniref:PsbP C-terminal domain-containing protein n=1 Tax=Lithospermum erythrorhizon TaxID=34254 RepID=A0AAV3R9Q3_LITER
MAVSSAISSTIMASTALTAIRSSMNVHMLQPPSITIKASMQLPQSSITGDGEGNFKRRPLLLGLGALSLSLSPATSIFAEEIPESYSAFVDKRDGYSYVYPSDWREFDFRGHDSAFKDRYLQLQNVRLSFIPTENSDIHDLGPLSEVVPQLVKHVYAAPNQIVDIMEMKEKIVDGKSYCTFEYVLTSPNFARSAFATIAIANGRFYTLIVGANERRWRKVRNKMKVVADSFKVLDI